jgi:hypothetical protein
MNRVELYKQSIDILYQAYFDGTLKHGDCTACAVGNILKPAAQKIDVPNLRWHHLFLTVGKMSHKEDCIEFSKQQIVPEPGCMIAYNFLFGHMCVPLSEIDEHGRTAYQEAKGLVAASGYTEEELAEIEYAFEIADQGNSREDWMFNGLVAVLDELKRIHDVSDQDSQEALKPFHTHYQSLI